MPFLPPNQQRQSTEGTKTPGNTIQNTCIHCTEIKRWIQLNIKRNKMCRCRVMTIFYEHKTFFVSNFETTVHAISLNIVWSKLSEIVRWLYSVRVCDASWGEWRVNALYSRVLLGRQKGTCKSRTGRRHWYTSPGTKWGQQVCCRCSVGSLLLLRNTVISVSVCLFVRICQNTCHHHHQHRHWSLLKSWHAQFTTRI